MDQEPSQETQIDSPSNAMPKKNIFEVGGKQSHPALTEYRVLELENLSSYDFLKTHESKSSKLSHILFKTSIWGSLVFLYLSGSRSWIFLATLFAYFYQSLYFPVLRAKIIWENIELGSKKKSYLRTLSQLTPRSLATFFLGSPLIFASLVVKSGWGFLAIICLISLLHFLVILNPGKITEIVIDTLQVQKNDKLKRLSLAVFKEVLKVIFKSFLLSLGFLFLFFFARKSDIYSNILTFGFFFLLMDNIVSKSVLFFSLRYLASGEPTRRIEELT